jgi:hypothetical protein
MAGTFLYINDSLGNTWEVGVNTSGNLLQPVMIAPTSPLGIVIQDSVSGIWYKLIVQSVTIGATTFETLSIMPSSPWAGGQEPYLQDSGGFTWQLVIASQMLGTAPFIPTGALVGMPQIIWPSLAAGGPGAGSHSFLLTTFPRFQPAPTGTGAQQMDYVADLKINVFSAGSAQLVWARSDQFFEGSMEFVQAGQDITNWQQFILYALGSYGTTLGPGGDFPFDFYPNSRAPQFSTYVWEEDSWQAAYRFPGFYTFALKWRVYISP